ncbi:MAG TPA: XRE family transcriptional regulator [Epsilonproteobacteria bacterium]|nr:XRE family transcriptional regulator [Campylobacterota bacterium]
MKIIAKLLRQYRDLQDLTQMELVNALIEYSDKFNGLNIVTLSRWETETTKPGLKKRQTLLKFLFSKGCFANTTCRNMIKERYGYLQEDLEKTFDRQFKHLIGNFPESDSFEYTIHTLKDHPEKALYFELIVEIEQASHPTDCLYNATPQILEKWCEHPASFAIVCESRRQHAGHYILLKLKSSVADDIVHHQRSLFSITMDDFCDVEEKGTYLALTLFSRSGKVAALLNIEHYIHLIEQMNHIEKIVIFSRREDAVPMTKDYGIHLVASGTDEKEGYQWYGLSAPLEDILFADTVVEAIY